MENDTFVDDLRFFSIAIKFPDAILYVYKLLYICYCIYVTVYLCMSLDVLRFVFGPWLFHLYPPNPPCCGSTSPHHHEAASVEASCARLWSLPWHLVSWWVHRVRPPFWRDFTIYVWRLKPTSLQIDISPKSTQWVNVCLELMGDLLGFLWGRRCSMFFFLQVHHFWTKQDGCASQQT
jgi:hypothetical protein